MMGSKSSQFLSLVTALTAGAAAVCVVACNAESSLPNTLNGTPPAADAGPAACADDEPTFCPDPSPSYQTDIVPILETHCLICHRVGGLEPTDHNFDTYAAVANDLPTIGHELNECAMPPLDAGVALPTASKVTLLTWIFCGGLNN